MSPRSILGPTLSPIALLIAGLTLASCGGGSESGGDDGDVGAAIIDEALGGDADPAQADESDANDDAASPGQGSFSGLATFVIDGATYELTSDECVPAQPDEIVDSGTRFALSGSGQVDGDQMYGKVLRTEVDFDGDGSMEFLHTITVEVGAEANSQAPSGKPSLLVQLSEGDVADGLGVLSVDFEPGRLSGTGEIFDRNEVLAAANEPLGFTFVATCVPAG
jgi:hypothetical protein